MKSLTWILVAIISVYLLISAIRPDLSQNLRDEWRSLFAPQEPSLLPTTTYEQTQTPTPVPTRLPTQSPTQRASIAINPTPTATHIPPSATPIPANPSPSGIPRSRLLTLRQYALTLINEARIAAGLNEVTLDNNAAAQSHAEDMRANCVTGHWGTDGLKPYMRYTLAGGDQYSAENVSGSGFCSSTADRYITKSITEEIDEAMDGLMNSPGHRRNILNPHHRKVNIGISYQRPNLWLVQLFVGDYVEYLGHPKFEDGILSLNGTVKNGAVINDDRSGVQIYYDQVPHELTRGQLHHTNCYGSGKKVAALRPPTGPNTYYPTDSFSESGIGCPDPYRVQANAQPATSYFDLKTRVRPEYSVNVVWITATHWHTAGDKFSISADIRNLLSQYGDGVYTIVLWGEIDGEDVPISEYSISIPPLKTSQAHIFAHVTPTSVPSPTPTPTQTSTPTITPTLIPTSTPTVTPTLIPISTPTVTPTSTPSPTPTATPKPTPTTPSGLSEDALTSAREYALALINQARTATGLNSVTLDNNTAAQFHAEDMRANCFSSHWGSDGLKPYMRYTTAGGHQYSAENVSGSSFCPSTSSGYITRPITEQLDEAMNGLMNSPGHRRNILNPHHRKVNIGISYQHPNLWLVQLFVGDYLEYSDLPTIQNDSLSLSGSVKNGVTFIDEHDLGIQIYYHAPPHHLARGQLSRTYCYSSGLILASLRPPLEANWYYDSDTFTIYPSYCPSPYDVAADAPGPNSYDQVNEFWREAYNDSHADRVTAVSVSWVTATDWEVTHDAFSVTANIGDLLEDYGQGVYTIVLWGEIDGEHVPISEYSIFVSPSP